MATNAYVTRAMELAAGEVLLEQYGEVCAQLAECQRERDEWRDSAQVVLDEKAELLTENRLLLRQLCAAGVEYLDAPLTTAEVERVKALEEELIEARRGFTDYAETAGRSLRELVEKVKRLERIEAAARQTYPTGEDSVTIDRAWLDRLMTALAEGKEGGGGCTCASSTCGLSDECAQGQV